MPDVRIINIRCRQKPTTPQQCGYVSWDYVQAAMDRQEGKDFDDKVRPCVPHNGWVHYRSCQRCDQSIWDLEVDGENVVAVYEDGDRKATRLKFQDGRGDMEFSFKDKTWRKL